jgi:hypothetical protein
MLTVIAADIRGSGTAYPLELGDSQVPYLVVEVLAGGATTACGARLKCRSPYSRCTRRQRFVL